MRKFVQLAEDVESDLRELDNDADELDMLRRDNKEAARQVVNDHHSIQSRIKDGIEAMRRVSEAAGLPNSRPRTSAELAAIKVAEELAKNAVKPEGEKVEISAGEVGEVPELGEGSGDTPPDATFQPKAE